MLPSIDDWPCWQDCQREYTQFHNAAVLACNPWWFYNLPSWSWNILQIAYHQTPSFNKAGIDCYVSASWLNFCIYCPPLQAMGDRRIRQHLSFCRPRFSIWTLIQDRILLLGTMLYSFKTLLMPLIYIWHWLAPTFHQPHGFLDSLFLKRTSSDRATWHTDAYYQDLVWDYSLTSITFIWPCWPRS